MQKTVETIRGDTPGTQWQFSVYRYGGRAPDAPSAYLQAALHGDELPGVAALHYLMPMLAKAEAEGRLLGSVTVLPFANPIATGQHLSSGHLGRYAFDSRVNFNRDFPLLDDEDTTKLPGDDAPIGADKRLKARLLKLAIGHDLVLDLHCDDESLSYIYVAAPYWPHLADLAACLGCEAVLLWDGSSDGAFEEAAYAPYRRLSGDDPVFKRRAVTTVEFRGRADVSPELAMADALGLYGFLVARGAIADDGAAAFPAFAGPVTPLDHVEVLRAPTGGALLYHVKPGDTVATGAALVTILVAPGEDGGSVTVTAPQAGLILTRRAHRLTRVGDDLLKLLGSERSAEARAGALED